MACDLDGSQCAMQCRSKNGLHEKLESEEAVCRVVGGRRRRRESLCWFRRCYVGIRTKIQLRQVLAKTALDTIYPNTTASAGKGDREGGKGAGDREGRLPMATNI